MRCRPTYLVLILLLAHWSISTCNAANDTALTVGNLRCEYLQNPLGLDVAQPRLSWIITAAHRGMHQSAYRILVASSAKLLEQDQGDLWDSQKVATDESIQIEYAGKPLQSAEVCYWKTQIWDQTGQSSGWSEPAFWTTGLLKSDDWTGNWIGAEPATDEAAKTVPPPAPLLRKTFVLDKPISRATAYVCALGYYELSLNGSKVGDHLLDPPVTQFDKRALYVTYDVTRQLATGKNAIGVELGSSWYNCTVPDAWDFQRAPWRALPQMRLQLDVEFTDGSHQQIVSDSSWKLSTGPRLYDQMRVGEIYDARLEKTGWTTADYDDTGWNPVALREGPKGIVSASNVEPCKVTATIKPVKLTQRKPGVYVFDMGQNLAGVPELKVTGAAGTVIHLKCGELLGADGTVSTKNISLLVKTTGVQCDTYTLKGGGEETWSPKFTFHGFQYVQVEGFPAEPAVDAITAKVIHTSFDPAGSFVCSNPLLNKIEQATIWSYISNFVGIPSDCPHREKNGWTGDAQLAVQMGLEHFHSEAAYTQWIDTFQDGMRDDGKLACIAPTSGWGYNRLDGPAWESAYLLVPWEMYQQSGDKRILESHYDGFKKWIDWYTRIAKDHIINYGLGDWAPVKTKSPDALTSTAYYYRDLLIIAQTAKLLNKPEEAKQFQDLADQTRVAFNAQFFDPKTEQYGGGTQTSLACALYQGMVDPTDQAKVAEDLANKVHTSNDHIDTGILGAKYLLRALSDNGHADVAWTLATQRTAPSWGNWIDRGATTLWEEWNGSNSRNHVMFGDISSWFIEYLAGIRTDPAAPGYKKFTIHPLLLGDLTSAKATRNSMYGNIACEWNRAADQLTLKLTVPANTTATVYIPAKNAGSITESGKPAAGADGVAFQRMDGNAAVFTVGSGDYDFSSTLP